MRVEVDNDATCATVAEWKTGVGVGITDLVLVTLGTGIGGGLVVNGELVRGRNGFAGEFGHMVVDPTGPLCPCGRRGCWERYASGSGLAMLAREAAIARRCEAVVELAGGDPQDVRGEHVQFAARAGDVEALAVIDEFARWVALGLSNLTNALDPEMFVLGGGLAAGADLYLDRIVAWFGELLYQPHLREIPRIEFATSGPRAGADRRRPARHALTPSTLVCVRKSVGRSTEIATQTWSVARVGGLGFADLRPGFVAAAEAVGGGVLARLERLVHVEEVLDLLDELRREIGEVVDVGEARLLRRDTDQLGVLAGLVLHEQHADGAAFDDDAGIHRILEQHERIERVAVAGERVRG